MKHLIELKWVETRLKDQIATFNKTVQDYQRKLLATEEIVWDLKKKLSVVQREIIVGFKELTPDEVLAVRSGLSVEEIRKGKALLKETSLWKPGLAGEEFTKITKKEKAPRSVRPSYKWDTKNEHTS